jgi:hypothetical protein
VKIKVAIKGIDKAQNQSVVRDCGTDFFDMLLEAALN